ncbi:MAG: DUF5106 domain-containing protein, partial [Ferruginibacter sp.]
MQRFYFSFLFVCFSATAWAGTGYEIKVKLKGYQEKGLYLAYYYGDKQYIKDTAYRNSNGEFVFKDEKTLESGLYLIVMTPDNEFFQLLIDKEDQQFSVETDVTDILQNMAFKGAAKNTQLFTNYLKYLSTQGNSMKDLSTKLSAAKNDNAKRKNLQMQIDLLDKKVRSYQQNIISSNKGSLTAAMIKASIRVEPPQFSGDEKEQEFKKWRFAQQHYFDNLDLADGRLLRTPVLHSAVDYYIDKLQIQHPDTLVAAIDNLLTRFSSAEESFKYYLIYFLNKYAKSNLVGMDAVYVHLAQKYYATGKAPWTDEDQLAKIIDNADKLEPLLIGKKAPALKLNERSGQVFELEKSVTEFNILYFWKNNTSRAKKDFKTLKAFYAKYGSKDVGIFAVCMDREDDINKSWEIVDENDITGFTHLYPAGIN